MAFSLSSFSESPKARLITGLALLALLIVGLSLGGLPLRLMILVVSLLGLWEFYNMTMPGSTQKRMKAFGLACGALVVMAGAIGPFWIHAALVLPIMGAAVAFLYNFGMAGRPESRLESGAFMVMGILYVPLILQLGLGLSAAEQILVLGSVILTDTGGYYVGSRYGGDLKIWPSVSPKKSWAGSFGGLVFCTAFCVLLGCFGSHKGWSLPTLPVWGWALLGITLNLAAQFGDFFESALKRTLDCKDSGTILPGHGGILDRVDSLLFAMPVYAIAAELLRTPTP